MDNKIFVECVKKNSIEGPYDIDVFIASAKYRIGRKEKWLTLVDYDGKMTFFNSNNDISEQVLDQYHKDNEFNNDLSKLIIKEFEEVQLMDDLYFQEEYLMSYDNNQSADFINYLLSVEYCDEDIQERLVGLGCGKYVDEIDAFPIMCSLGFEFEW